MKNEGYYLTGIQKLEKTEMPMPAAADDGVVVKIEYLGVCGSDIHMFHDDFGCLRDVERTVPIKIGHECAGTIVEVGKHVRHVKIGDRVAVEPGVPCGKCEYCKKGLYNLCPDMRFLGCAPDYEGAMQRYLGYPAEMVYKLPENVSTMEGALVEPLCVGLHATALSGIGLGDTAVIVGTGCIGLATLLACKARGVSRIVVIDIFDNRLTKAAELGAEKAFNSRNCDVVKEVINYLGYEPQYIFETAGNASVVDTCIKLAGNGGVITFVGNIPQPAAVVFGDLAAKEITIRTVFRYRNLYPTAIQAMSGGFINLKQIVNKEFRFDEMQHAIEECDANRQEIVKAVVRYD